MSTTAPASLDQIGVPIELRERARMLWLLTAIAGAWGWAICSFAWKVPGQEQDAWFQRQLKLALAVGLVGWVGYLFCFVGWFAHLALGALGFVAIGKGQDYQPPLLGGLVGGGEAAPGRPAVAARPAAPAARPATAPAQPTPVRAEAQPRGAAPGGHAAVSLDPIEGVSLQTWAWAQAHADLGHPLETILARAQVDPARWKRVTAQWLVRRATDRSGAVQAEYDRYRPVQAAAQAQAAAQPAAQARVQAQVEPIALERWVEVSVALELAQVKGWDAGQLLGNFGLAPSDWGAAHAWWAQAFPGRCQDPAFRARYDQLQQYYRQYYQGR